MSKTRDIWERTATTRRGHSERPPPFPRVRVSAYKREGMTLRRGQGVKKTPTIVHM